MPKFLYIQCLQPNVIGEDKDDTPIFQTLVLDAPDLEEAHVRGMRHFGPSVPRATMLNDHTVELPVNLSDDFIKFLKEVEIRGAIDLQAYARRLLSINKWGTP